MPLNVTVINGVFLDRVTYVRTEVNYTEEVDDPVDSDGEDSVTAAAAHQHYTMTRVRNSIPLFVFCRRRGPGLREPGVQHL